MSNQLQAEVEIQKVRRCLEVLTEVAAGGSPAMQLTELRDHHGPGWSVTSVLQAIAGKKALSVIEQLDDVERQRGFVLHWVARSIVHHFDLGAVTPPDGIDLERIRQQLEAHR